MNSPGIEKKLHIGCGGNFLEGWLNTDIFSKNGVIYFDVIKKFPFQDNTFDFVLAEHLIEHIHYRDTQKMLFEIFRILKPGGVVRIATPFFDRYIHLYKDKLSDFEKNVIETILNDWVRPGFYNAINYRPPVDSNDTSFFINDIFMNYEHRFIYNKPVLVRIISDAGFPEIYQCISGKSKFSAFHNLGTHIDEVNSYLTLTVEAIK